LQVANDSELRNLDVLIMVQQRLKNISLSQSSSRVACLPVATCKEGLSAALARVQQELNEDTEEAAMAALVMAQAANFDLFCTVNTLDREISSLKEAVEALHTESKEQVCDATTLSRA
jgi:hypothetical protein